MLRLVIVEATTRGAMTGVFSLLLHAGPDTCDALGWLAGLAILPLGHAARLDIVSRLAYRALLSALLNPTAGSAGAGGSGSVAALVAPSACASVAGWGLGGVGGSELAAWAVTAAGALLLGAACARVLGEYAKAVTGQPSRLGITGVQALHFMLGFDGVT